MSSVPHLWLTVARVIAVLNLGLLLGLGWVWLQQYRQHGAAHTRGLFVFAAFLFVENGLWVYFYTGKPDFINWYSQATLDIQIGMTMLCGLELVALLALFRITWV